MITIEVSEDGLTGGLQLAISDVDEKGNGHGYRIAGPNFNGTGKVLLRAVLGERDVNEISAYLARCTEQANR